jgi:branched-chain amino acid transport system ATP-binding protein
MAETALTVQGLEVRYGPVAAVRDVSFEVGKGEIVGLIGPNGAGKSTTLHAIMGLVPAVAGSVKVGGTPVLGRPPEAIARVGVGLVPEGRRIFADFTVEENLQAGTGRRVRALPGARADASTPGRRAVRGRAAAARDRASAGRTA